MNSPKPRFVTAANWEDAYREGTPPWDHDQPHAALVRVIEEKRFPKGASILELGCGTGADAVYLARRRFEVTAVDCSPIALERARLRAEQHDALLRFVLDDMFEFARSAGQFDVIYDAGVYHFIRLVDLEKYLDMLWRVTRPGSYFFGLIGAAGETAEGGPPQVTESEIHNELGRLFEPVQLLTSRIESSLRPDGYMAWSCLMRRPPLAAK
jgi:SAM-dependent methyltransferase